MALCTALLPASRGPKRIEMPKTPAAVQLIDDRASLARRVARRVPFSLVRSVTDGELIIPYYHVVSDDLEPYVRGLYQYRTSKQFREDLEFLLRHYRPLALDDLLRAVHDGTAPPARSCLLTFDDGFACMHKVAAPILERMGVPAVFFLITGFMDNQDMGAANKAALLAAVADRVSEHVRRAADTMLTEAGLPRAELGKRLLLLRDQHCALIDRLASLMEVSIADYLAKHQPYLSREQARDLVRRGFAIGAHSVDHPYYPALPLDAQLWQTRESLRILRQDVDPACASFAFPYTDRGVALDFYQAVREEGLVSLCFGTAGMQTDPVSFSFQRFSMEKEGLTARQVLSQEYTRKVARVITGANTVRRAASRSEP